MSNPFNVNVNDERLTSPTMWTSEMALALMRRDLGMLEKPFHIGIAEMTRSVSTGTFQSFSQGITAHFPVSDLADTGFSLTWRLGLYLLARVPGSEEAQFRLNATNATTYGTANANSPTYTEIHVWCEGSVWPPSSIELQAAQDNPDPPYTVYVKRDWTDNGPDCYLRIDEV